jgi:hypothetical protein
MWARGLSSIGIGIGIGIGMGTADDAARARACMIGRASCVLPLHARSAWPWRRE